MKKLNNFVSKTLAFVSVLAILSLSLTSAGAQTSFNKFDYFGNNLAAWSVFTFPSTNGQITWNLARNDNPTPTAPGQARILSIPWGESGTAFVPSQGDYDGNGVDDLNIYFGNTGVPANSYAILPLNTSPAAPGNPIYLQWGSSATDTIGAEGDYDGDGKMDPTVVRENGAAFTWYILRSSTNSFISFNYGIVATDLPLPGANYGGTSSADDPAVARVGPGGALTWIYSNTAGAQIGQTQWGDFDTDFIIPAGDYDGDRLADFMVWRGFGAVDGVWYLRTNSGTQSFLRFGQPGTTSVRDTALRSGDYDGDGKTDIAVYRPSNFTFYVNRSTGGVQSQQWGGGAGNTTLPIASFGIQ